jgi:haloalkane dehalogenase
MASPKPRRYGTYWSTNSSHSAKTSRAWAGLAAFEKPFLTAFAEHEDITRSFERIFQSGVPGAQGREHVTVPAAGHFLQEQQPDLLVDAILSLS